MQALPEDTQGVTVRLRVGAFPAVNLVLAAVFTPVFASLIVVGAVFTGHAGGPGDRAWSALGTLVAVVATVATVAWLAVSANGLRPVVVVTGPGGSVSVPRVGLRRGFGREVLPLERISSVLDLRGGPRNKRWQLIIRPRGGAAIGCDSVTSSRAATAAVRDTPAGRAVRWLDEQARAARRPA